MNTAKPQLPPHLQVLDNVTGELLRGLDAEPHPFNVLVRAQSVASMMRVKAQKALHPSDPQVIKSYCYWVIQHELDQRYKNISDGSYYAQQTASDPLQAQWAADDANRKKDEIDQARKPFHDVIKSFNP